MKTATGLQRRHHVAKAGVLLVMVGLIAGMAGCYSFLRLAIDSTEGGSVTTPGEGSFTYFSLQCCPLIKLVAVPEEGYDFIEWTSTGAVGGDFDKKSPDTYLLLGGDGSVTAHFARE